MTFNDVFKSSFLENVTEFSAVDTLIGMLFALVIGLFIFVVYKKTFNGVMYSTGFAMTLVGLSLVTTLVIMAVTSNVVLSLGMVGALSIVRFRAAIKEPVEIVYLFWAIADLRVGERRVVVGYLFKNCLFHMEDVVLLVVVADLHVCSQGELPGVGSKDTVQDF